MAESQQEPLMRKATELTELGEAQSLKMVSQSKATDA